MRPQAVPALLDPPGGPLGEAPHRVAHDLSVGHAGLRRAQLQLTQRDGPLANGRRRGADLHGRGPHRRKVDLQGTHADATEWPRQWFRTWHDQRP